jgi:CHAD domain-containing protein
VAKVVRLQTLEGPVRGTLRRSAKPPGDPPDPLQLLSDSLRDRRRKFRRRFQDARKARRTADFDEAVHDLRTSSRRLMSTLEALGAFAGRRRAERLRDRVDAVLDASGNVRDLAVLASMLDEFGRSAALKPFRRELAERRRRAAKKLRGKLGRARLRAIRRDLRKLEGKVPRSVDRDDALARVLETLKATLGRVLKTRRALDPTDVDSIHRTRVALKNLRYLSEETHPLVPGIGPSDVETLHKLQTTMGDLHDLEVLSSALSRHASAAPPKRASSFAPVLEEVETRHHRMLRSFLRAVDPILARWSRALDVTRRVTAA